MNTITYFDFCELRYASFFLNGFLENESARGYRLEISRQVPPEFEDLDPVSNWLTAKVPLSLYRVQGSDPFLFCIDAGDNNGGSEPVAEFFKPFLERCRYYFKVNYNADVIAENDVLKPFASKIKPVPLVFPITPSQPWRLRPKLTPVGGRPWPRATIKRRIRFLRNTLSLQQYRQLRNRERDIDLFFVTTLYPRSKFKELVAKRRVLIDALNQHKQFNIIARYACGGKIKKEECGPYAIELMSYQDYLQYSARSRIGVYIRGNSDGLSFKFGELMAMGRPIVGETLCNNVENMYAYDRFDEQFAFDDPEELVERIVYLLQAPREIEELRRTNIETFENHFTPKPIVKDILDQIDTF